MKKLLLLLSLALALFLVVASQALSLADRGTFREWRANRPSKLITVGVDWPVSTNQDGVDKALTLAQEEINATGVLGRQIKLVLRDSHMDSEKAMGIAREFANDSSMSAVIGLYDDTLAVRASAIFEEAKLLHLNIGVNNSYLTSHGFRYLISTVLANDKIGPSLARFAVGKGFKSYAVVAEQGAFGEDLAFHFNMELDNLDARVVYQTTYVRGMQDFRDIVNEIRASGADMIFFAGFERESALFIRSARTMGLKTQIMGTFDNTPLVQDIAGPFLEGVWTYDYWDPDTATPENQAFVAKYRARFQEDPTSNGAQAYDALYLLASAIDHTGSVHGLDVSYALRCMNSWQGANGTYKFDLAGALGDKMIYLYTFHYRRPMLMASNLAMHSPRRIPGSSTPQGQAAPEPQAQVTSAGVP